MEFIEKKLNETHDATSFFTAKAVFVYKTNQNIVEIYFFCNVSEASFYKYSMIAATVLK